MSIVLTLLAASALLGLAIGLIFRVWANLLAAPCIAVFSTLVLHFSGFKFAQGVLVTAACLFVSQLAYFVVASLMPRSGITGLLARDMLDNEPDEARKYDIGDQQQKRDEHPSRPSSPET